MQSRFICLSF